MKQYSVRKTFVTKQNNAELYAYMETACQNAKNLYNAALYRERNNFSARYKIREGKPLTTNEQEVQDAITKTVKEKGIKKPKTVLTYFALCAIMTATHNPDYYAKGLSSQASQQVLKQVNKTMKSWLEASKAYKANPEAFTGKPKMPKYKKGSMAMVRFTNQDCHIRKEEKGVLSFPLTKTVLSCGKLPDDAVLKEVQISPEYGGFLVFVIFESEIPTECSDASYTAMCDLGVSNFASIVSNAGVPCRIFKGGMLKSESQWYNKQTAYYKSILMKEKDPKTFHCPTTHKLEQLSRHRTFFLEDRLHKMAKEIVCWCRHNRIGTFVCGVNEGWKQNADMGHKGNQNFVQLPFARFRQMLQYLCERNGILFVEQEESYTSKASAVDGDAIPTYGKDDAASAFSGKRIKRGLYRTADGTCVNADLNGAANIGRKYDAGIFAG